MKITKMLARLVPAVVLFAGLPILAQTNDETFSFANRELSLPVQRAGMFVGQSGGALILGGGRDQAGRPSADVFVQVDSGWKKLSLNEPVAFAGFVSGTFAEKIGGFPRIFIAGGIGTNGITDKVFSLELKEFVEGDAIARRDRGLRLRR